MTKREQEIDTERFRQVHRRASWRPDPERDPGRSTGMLHGGPIRSHTLGLQLSSRVLVAIPAAELSSF